MLNVTSSPEFSWQCHIRAVSYSCRVIFVSCYIRDLLTIPSWKVVCQFCPFFFFFLWSVHILVVLWRSPVAHRFRKGIHSHVVIIAAHSPVLTHLNASLEGLDTIRAFSAESRCTRDFDQHYNFSSGTWFTEQVVYCWFHLRINFVAALYCVFVVFACLSNTGKSFMLRQCPLKLCYSRNFPMTFQTFKTLPLCTCALTQSIEQSHPPHTGDLQIDM